jgi:HK97 family phage major capsid protein
MESLKSLIEKRNKLVADARAIICDADGKVIENLAADLDKQADALLTQADALDRQIADRQKSEANRERLAQLESQIGREVPRQTAPSKPGAGPAAQPEALSVQVGRHEVRLSPGSSDYARATPEYARSFAQYLSGDYEGRGGPERLGLIGGDATKGGYMAPMAMVGGLIKFLDDNVFMRQLATVLPPTTARSVGALSYDTDYDEGDWTAEVPASDISEDDDARWGKREMTPHLLTKLVKMSQLILRNAVVNLDAFVISRLGYKIALTEEKNFVGFSSSYGTGSQQPLGVFTASADGITTSQDVTASASTSFTGDDLLNALYDLKESYQRRSTWLVSREFVKRARKLKDGNGQYLWQPGLTGGQPGLILDRPYVMSEFVPSTYTTGLYVAAIGDFSHYWIQDGLGFEIQRLSELFALRNQVGVVARKQTDGMPVLAEAFRRLKLA